MMQPKIILFLVFDIQPLFSSPNAFVNCSAIHCAISGGTAFPTCLNCCVLLPKKIKSSETIVILHTPLTVGTDYIYNENDVYVLYQ